MAKEEQFSFIPESQLTSKSSEAQYRVSITSNRMLYFPREIMEIYDLDKRFFKFFADIHKKAIAWKTIDGGSLSDLTGYRKLGIINAGAGQISIMKLMSAIGLSELEGSISEIPVMSYKGTGYLDEPVDYIIIDPKKAKKRGRRLNDGIAIPGEFPGEQDLIDLQEQEAKEKDENLQN